MKAQLETIEGSVLTSIQNLNLSFGGVSVLNDVFLDVFNGELISLIGPNGAGKTSLLNCISGFYTLRRATYFFRTKTSAVK